MFTWAAIRGNKFNEKRAESKETAGKVVIKDKTHKLSTHHLRFKGERCSDFPRYFRHGWWNRSSRRFDGWRNVKGEKTKTNSEEIEFDSTKLHDWAASGMRRKIFVGEKFFLIIQKSVQRASRLSQKFDGESQARFICESSRKFC